MSYTYQHIGYRQTGYFSKLVTDYIDHHPDLDGLYNFTPDYEGIKQAINQRSNYPVNRDVLVNTLTAQYAGYLINDNTAENIRLLKLDNTFTVCTAHQPNLLTGYLYFVYKILHAVKLAEDLSQQFPNHHFVPVYYMGSEDNDLEELGTFKFGNRKYVWDGSDQKGAVGRMETRGLQQLLDELFQYFGPPGENCDKLKTIITTAYLEHQTIGAATRYLVNELFGQYGLVILDPDDKAFKSLYIPVMENELLQTDAYQLVKSQAELMEQKGYNIQAQPRHINLFYLDKGLRERIEHTGEEWQVLNTSIKWNREQLLEELHQFPEKFSPNVILRGMLQETLLPDVAFIGGGAEVAYWLELMPLFRHYQVFYPVILLRQSVLWINSAINSRLVKTNLFVAEFFKNKNDLVKDYIIKHSEHDLELNEEKKSLEELFEKVKRKAGLLDKTLEPATMATYAKSLKLLENLGKKMLRAEKRKSEHNWAVISAIRDDLFPAGQLQERVENFSGFYLDYGSTFFDKIKKGIEPLRNELLMITAK